MECILCLAGGVAAANCHCLFWWATADPKGWSWAARAGRTPPIAPELGIERASALHVQRLACSSQQPAALPSLLLRRSPQRSAAETCADLRNTSSPLRARPHCAVRRHRSRHPPSAIRCPRPPANDWLGTCVTGLQLPASPRPTSRPHSRREQRSGAHVAVAFAGHPTAVLRPAECTSHSAGRRAR